MEQLNSNMADSQIARHNMQELDGVLGSYGAGGVIPSLDQIMSLEKMLDQVKNPISKVSVNDSNGEMDTVKELAHYGLTDSERRIQDQITNVEAGIQNTISSLNIAELVVQCSFLYDNRLPLPQNWFSATAVEGTNGSGIIESVSFDGKQVSVTAKRLI
jgi:hypothetical protein